MTQSVAGSAEALNATGMPVVLAACATVGVCTCIYLFMTCIYACTYAYIYVCTYVCSMYICMYECMDVCDRHDDRAPPMECLNRWSVSC